MPIRARYHLNQVDQARFQVHTAAFERYLNANQRHRVQVGDRNHERMEVVEFDEAEVTTAFHPSVSVEDSDPRPHVTVRLTNSELRQGSEWYTLHWRPEGQGPSLVLPRRNNASSLALKRQRKKEKDQRRKDRKRDDQDKKDKDDQGKKENDKKDDKGSAATIPSGRHSQKTDGRHHR